MKNGLSTMSIIILMLVIVCAVLGILSTATANSDLTRAEKQADYVSAMQDCTNEAQDWIAETAKTASEGETFAKVFSDGEGHSLSAEIVFKQGKCRVLRWEMSTEWTESKPLDVMRKK